MIYSIIPYETVMNEEPAAPNSEWVSKNGRFFEVEKLGSEKYISRIVSTNPADYLNPAFAPGVKFKNCRGD